MGFYWQFAFFFGYCDAQPPKPSDRAQVQSKEVRLPDSGPIPLDDQDVQNVSIFLSSFLSKILFKEIDAYSSFYFFLSIEWYQWHTLTSSGIKF